MLQQMKSVMATISSTSRLLSSVSTLSRNKLLASPSVPVLQNQYAFLSRSFMSLVKEGTFQKSSCAIPQCSGATSGASLTKLWPWPCSTTSVRNYWTDWPKAKLDWARMLRLHKEGPHKKFRPPRKPLGGAPMLKGVVLKTLIKKPKKPNSANRKCVLVRLSNGEEKIAYIPGIGHNLQEHNVVLVRCGRLQDVPGVKLKCIRGKYDLAHVIKQPQK